MPGMRAKEVLSNNESAGRMEYRPGNDDENMGSDDGAAAHTEREGKDTQ